MYLCKTETVYWLWWVVGLLFVVNVACCLVVLVVYCSMVTLRLVVVGGVGYGCDKRCVWVVMG